MESGKLDIPIPTVKYLDVFRQVCLSVNGKPSISFFVGSQLKTQLHQAALSVTIHCLFLTETEEGHQLSNELIYLPIFD